MKLLIIEDEFILATDLRQVLTNEGYKVYEAQDNGPEALEFVKQNEVDLILCDIHIKGPWDGIETIQKILEVSQVPVIYLTAFTDKETVVRAKKTLPAAYISKPFHKENLRIAVEMAIYNFAIQNTNKKSLSTETAKDFLRVNTDIFIKRNARFVKLSLGDILYLLADNSYTNIFTPAKYAIREPLSTVLGRLALPELIRVHRSFAVSLNKIDSFSENEIRIGEVKIPIGRSFKEAFMKGFKFH